MWDWNQVACFVFDEVKQNNAAAEKWNVQTLDRDALKVRFACPELDVRLKRKKFEQGVKDADHGGDCKQGGVSFEPDALVLVVLGGSLKTPSLVLPRAGFKLLLVSEVVYGKCAHTKWHIGGVVCEISVNKDKIFYQDPEVTGVSNGQVYAVSLVTRQVIMHEGTHVGEIGSVPGIVVYKVDRYGGLEVGVPVCIKFYCLFNARHDLLVEQILVSFDLVFSVVCDQAYTVVEVEMLLNQILNT